MKKLLLALIAVPFFAQAECKKPTDPKKVMLFVDVNYSDLEIETTEKAACDRGERLVVVPGNYKEYTKYISASESAQKEFEKCARKMAGECEQANQNARTKYKELEDFKKKQPKIPDAIKAAMEEVKSTGGKLRNISISGHDGGGSFGGFKGNFGRVTLADIIKDYSDINEVTSILLLGCYTGVQKEVYEWKNIFPNVKLIGGYDGSAPLSDKPFGHQYIRDLLMKEKDLLKQADEKKLLSYVKQNIASMGQMHSALYLQCNDGTNQGEFYYGSEHKAEGFKKLNIKECESKKEEMQEIATTFNKYYSGELEVPKDTARGELRQLYNRARRNEHCQEVTKIDVNVNGIFNLLFYDGVKQNFSNYFKEDLETAETILAEFDSQKLKEAFDKSLQGQVKTLEEIKKETAELETNPAAYIEAQTQEYLKLEEELKLLTDKGETDLNISYEIRQREKTLKTLKTDLPKFIEYRKQFIADREETLTKARLNYDQILQAPKIWAPTADNLKNKSRKELLENASSMHRLLTAPGTPPKLSMTLLWMIGAQSNHLQQFQNPFSWHEYTGQTEAPEQTQRLKNFLDMN